MSQSTEKTQMISAKAVLRLADKAADKAINLTCEKLICRSCPLYRIIPDVFTGEGTSVTLCTVLNKIRRHREVKVDDRI